MAYIGRGTESISNVEVLDNLTFNGSASYTLQKSSVNFVPSSANNLLISISGVVQQGNFSVSGSTITFDTTVSGSDTCDWILHYGTGLITTVADGAITEAKLGSNAVTTAKINNGAITSAKLDSGLALGKIGQVVEDRITGNDEITSTSTSFVSTGITLNITPTATSSKILLSFNSGGYSNNNDWTLCKIDRDGTNVSGDIYFRNTGLGGTIQSHFNTFFIDEPSSTSQLTYSIQYRAPTGTARLGSVSGASLIAMEVLA